MNRSEAKPKRSEDRRPEFLFQRRQIDEVKWIAPSEKDAASSALEKRLWDAADQFRANSGLKAQEPSA